MAADALNLSSEILDVLACPQCKSAYRTHMAVESGHLACRACEARWPIRPNGAIDFRTIPPRYAQPLFHSYWRAGQEAYETWARNLPKDAEFYRRQLQRSQEVRKTLERFVSRGVFVDVAGNDGRFRQLLDPGVAYVSVDAFLTVREDLDCEGRREAYPVLAQPCDFVCGLAEALPFRSASVDAMRCNAAIDQFWDPLAALNEMRRVLKPGARLLLGVHVSQSLPAMTRIKGRIRKLLGLRRDVHLYRPTKENLEELIALARLEPEPGTQIKPTGYASLLLRRL